MAHLASFFSTLASIALATTAFTSTTVIPHQVARAEWIPGIGDRVLLDTQNNWGYLLHENGLFIRFPIATGQRRNVSYIGRYYFAATPNWNWEIRSTDIKRDRITYGPTGRFLRLFKDGETRTSYGIHGHRDAESMLASEERFRSMGCVIVSEDILDLIEKTYHQNGDRLAVQSTYGNPFELLAVRREEETKTN